MKIKLFVHLLCVAGVASIVGCKRGGDRMDFRHNKTGKGTPVATFGDDSITVEELQQRFAELSPLIRARYQTPEQRKDYVEGLARFELLVAEARRRNLQNEPEVVEATKKAMYQKLMQKEFEEKKVAPTDAEIAEYYEKHKSDYIRPETFRLSDVFFAAKAEEAPERKKKKALAEEVLAKLKGTKPVDPQAFVAMVRQHSEDAATKPQDGDMRFLNQEELKTRYGAELAAAAAELKQFGDLSAVVETPLGFYILRLQGRQPGISHGLEQVKTQIQSRLQFERRTQNMNKFVEELKTKANYKLDEAGLAKVEVPSAAGPDGGTFAAPGQPPTPSSSAQSTKN
jgi:peptidyl-prolyl cis-trans isomerase C